ncbi:MAG: hypothetical protein J5614_04255 [Paludibacteraceae bacterium]|nr:hypothetical protein [Paludibacteraceae bacterium]
MKYTINTNGYSSSSDVSYKLLKLQKSLDDDITNEDGSAANSSILAMNQEPPSDTEESLGFEGDTDSDVDTHNDEKNAQQKDSNSLKQNYKNFIDSPTVANGLKTAAALANKASDFTKSSFAKINAIPENRREMISAKMVAQAADEPMTLGQQVKNFIGKAGKVAGFSALSVACLPAAAGALVANKTIKANDKKRALEDLQRQAIIIDEKLNSGSTDDPDTKADLLIAKRQVETAINKLKYGIDLRGVHATNRN